MAIRKKTKKKRKNPYKTKPKRTRSKKRGY